MSEKLLVQHCAPTLAGIKTGNLYSCTYTDRSALRDTLRRWNRLLRKKGLRILPLRMHNGRALIYVYRPTHLLRDLQHHIARRILREHGYNVDLPVLCIRRLAERLTEDGEFPHEIGLFLGYPPEDVSGFMENHARDCKCEGLWKVYGDAESAQKKFAQYKKCTAVYCSHHANGCPLERLTVAA